MRELNLRCDSVKETHERQKTHCNDHHSRNGPFQLQPAIPIEPGKIGQFHPDTQKSSDRCQNEKIVSWKIRRSRIGHHSFTDTYVKKRNPRNRRSTDQIKNNNPRHFPSQPTEMSQARLANRVNDRSGPHKKKGFVKKVIVGVSRCSVDRKVSTDPDRSDHIPNLADNMIRQNLANIVGEHRVTNPVKSHHNSANKKKVPTRETTS